MVAEAVKTRRSRWPYDACGYCKFCRRAEFKPHVDGCDATLACNKVVSAGVFCTLAHKHSGACRNEDA